MRQLSLGVVDQSMYGNWTSGNPVMLARPPQDFTDGGFAPVAPLTPATIDRSPDGLPRPQPRRWQYPVAWNMPSPPGTEGLRLAPFQQLRMYADQSTLLRACIDKRIEEILGLEWDIVPTLDAEKAFGTDNDRGEFDARRQQAIDFWQRPDPEYDTWHSWMRAVLEEIFVIDALSLYVAPPKKAGAGVFGSNLAALALIDGSTIRPLVDLHGGRPQPPAVAFQQYIWGVPRVDLLDIINQKDLDEALGEPDAKLRGDQMLYLPYRRRAQSPYGFSHVEACLIPTQIELNKQKYALNYYDEGNIPASWIVVGNAETPQQVRQWQDTLDAQIGDIGARHQATVLPHGSSAHETKPNAFQDHYDMANKEEIFAEFGLTAQEMGMMPERSGGLSGGSAAMSQQNTTQSIRTATKPLLQFLQRNLFDLITQQYLNQRDMRWVWRGLEPVEDEESKLQTNIALVDAGVKSRDELRVERGWQPWGLDLTKEPTVTTGSGVISLADPMATAQRQSVDPAKRTDPPNPTGGADSDADQGASSPLRNAVKPPADSGNPSPSKMIEAELSKLRNYLRHGKPLEKFQREALPDDLWEIVQEDRGVARATATSYAFHDPNLNRLNDMLATLMRKARRDQISELDYLQSASEVIGAEALRRGMPFDVCADIALKFTPRDTNETFWAKVARVGERLQMSTVSDPVAKSEQPAFVIHNHSHNYMPSQEPQAAPVVNNHVNVAPNPVPDVHVTNHVDSPSVTVAPNVQPADVHVTTAPVTVKNKTKRPKVINNMPDPNRTRVKITRRKEFGRNAQDEVISVGEVEIREPADE